MAERHLQCFSVTSAWHLPIAYVLTGTVPTKKSTQKNAVYEYRTPPKTSFTLHLRHGLQLVLYHPGYRYMSGKSPAHIGSHLRYIHDLLSFPKPCHELQQRTSSATWPSYSHAAWPSQQVSTVATMRPARKSWMPSTCSTCSEAHNFISTIP